MAGEGMVDSIDVFGIHLSGIEATLSAGALGVFGAFGLYEFVLHNFIDVHAKAAKKVVGHVTGS